MFPLLIISGIWMSTDINISEGKGGIQSKKNKKNDENSAFGVFDPPPPNAEKYNLLFLSFWHHSEQLWKNSFFPLEKVKKLRIFSQNWSSEGG